MTERLRAARCLDSSMLSGCPLCQIKTCFIIQWRGVPPKDDGKDHHVQAGNAYIRHLMEEHDISVEDLKVSHLPVSLDRLKQEKMEGALRKMRAKIRRKLADPGSPLVRGLDGDVGDKEAVLREVNKVIRKEANNLLVSFGFEKKSCTS